MQRKKHTLTSTPGEGGRELTLEHALVQKSYQNRKKHILSELADSQGKEGNRLQWITPGSLWASSLQQAQAWKGIF